MNPTARLKSWAPRLLLFSVLAILFLVGVIQYQWFSRSAAVEIEAAMRGLETSVRQTALREFQRYAPLVSDLQALNSENPREKRVTLHRVFKTYGPEGVTPDLLAWVGWAEAGAQTWEVQTSSDRWTDHSIEGEPWAPLLAPGGDMPNIALLSTTQNLGQTQTLFIQSSDKKQIFLLGIDQNKFWNSYVGPSLKEAFPGAQVSMTSGLEGPEPPRPPSFDSRSYTFNPIKALFASPASPPLAINVALPRFYDPWRGRNRSPGGENVQALGPQPGSTQIAVTLPPDAPVLNIERRLAWNWLGSTLLLVVLAAAFGIVTRQSGRLAALRQREREFVASVSHELRTPLTVIRSAADNFAQGIVAHERQGRYGQLILDQSLRLGRMIEEMLSFAQAEASTPAVRVQAPLVFEAWLADLRPPLEALAAARQVTLHWDVAGVPARGLTDPEALRLILENLVVNAVNHAYPYPAPSEASPRPVRITLRHLVPDRLELTIDDDGRGISPQEAKRVFEPFYRDQVSRDKQEKGSGLGLFLSRHQARRLGGDLKLETPWRRLDGSRRPGCRFVLTIPFRWEAGDGR